MTYRTVSSRWRAGVLLIGVVCASVTEARAQTASTPATPAVLVVPFDSDRDPRGYWLREGSAIALSDDLAALGVRAMSRDERLRAFESLRVPAVASLSHATVIRLGQVVGAARVIVGACALKGDVLTIRARPILLESARLGPEVIETGPLRDLFEIYARVARRIAADLRIDTSGGTMSHPPVAAFEQYVKGLLAESAAMKIAFLSEALRLDPTLQRARIAMWAVRTELGEHESALAVVRQVPSGHLLAREAQFLSSVSLLQIGRHQEAFDRLSELNRASRDISLLNNLGIVQLRRPGEAVTRRAVSYFSEAAALDPDPDVLFNLGYAYWLDRDMPNAIQSLREAVRRNPADDAAHYVLGVALQGIGNVGEGARERDLARQLSSEYAQWEATKPPPNTAPKGLERIRTELAIPAARRIEADIAAAGQRNQQELAAFHLDAGRRAYLAERNAEAVAELRRAVYLSPYDYEAHLLLGRVYLRGGRLGEAIDAFKISIWSRETAAARVALAEAYLAQGSPAEARSELKSVLTRDPSNSEARRLLGRIPPE